MRGMSEFLLLKHARMAERVWSKFYHGITLPWDNFNTRAKLLKNQSLISKTHLKLKWKAVMPVGTLI